MQRPAHEDDTPDDQPGATPALRTGVPLWRGSPTAVVQPQPARQRSAAHPADAESEDGAAEEQAYDVVHGATVLAGCGPTGGPVTGLDLTSAAVDLSEVADWWMLLEPDRECGTRRSAAMVQRQPSTIQWVGAPRAA